MRRIELIGMVAFAVGTGCSAGEERDPMTNDATNSMPGSGCVTAPESARVVTADWLNRSLTVFEYDCLIDADCSTDDAILSTVNLESYPPGPIELEHIPGTCEALVAVGAGFFLAGSGAPLVGSPDVPEGGGLLRVDLDTGEVLAEIATAERVMGLAVTPDGSTAFTANHGDEVELGHTMSVIDLQTNTETQALMIGRAPEQVALSEDGAWGVVNLAGDSQVRFFDPSDPAGTLSEPLDSGSDPSDVDFVGDRAVVANSLSLNVSIFDVTTPDSPTRLDDVEIAGGVPYGVTHVPGTSRVLVTSSLTMSTLVDLDVSTTPATTVATIELPGGRFPIGVAISPDAEHAFVAHARDHVLSVVDLETGEARGLTWLEQPGPTYVVVVP